MLTQAKKVLAREEIDIKSIIEQYFPFLMKFFNTEIGAQMRFDQPISGEFYYSNTDLATIRELINHIAITRVTRTKSYAGI